MSTMGIICSILIVIASLMLIPEVLRYRIS
jgi:hypothetical protein